MNIATQKTLSSHDAKDANQLKAGAFIVSGMLLGTLAGTVVGLLIGNGELTGMPGRGMLVGFSMGLVVYRLRNWRLRSHARRI
jgi:hypothetical protein